MAKGICKGCKKYKELNKAGYCNISNTLQGACNAESLGMAAGDKLVDAAEKWATQYVSKTTFQIIMSAIVILVFVVYVYSRK